METDGWEVETLCSKECCLRVSQSRFHPFVNMLVNEIGHPVIDKTGFQGLYDIRMKWAPDTPTPTGTAPPTEPYIFTAIAEQLGLRLVSTKGPVDVIVIDSAEKPTAN